jgi:hypothetical protein
VYSHLLYLLLRRESRCEVCWRWCWVQGLRNPRSIACEVGSHRFQDKLYNFENLFSLLVLFSWYCYWLFTNEVTICMKLDPGIHIVMHSVLSLKPGVTHWLAQGSAINRKTRSLVSLGPIETYSRGNQWISHVCLGSWWSIVSKWILRPSLRSSDFVGSLQTKWKKRDS